MSPPLQPAASYRSVERDGPDPETEADAIIELMHRSAALRRSLLVLSLGAALLGGLAGVVLYVSIAERIYGREAGFFFAAGGVVCFLVLHRLSGAVARARELRWADEMARRHALDAKPLTDALRMLK